jgi:hypothetical protein
MNDAVAMAPAMPPPNATPDSQDITASVSADFILRAQGAAGQKDQP